jgi:hypothetical protein
MDTTTSLAWTSLRVAAPAKSTASRTACCSGGTQRSRSSSVSGSGKVSATGPGPYTGPRGTPRTSVVTGRDWNSHSVSSRPIAHSTSCGPPNVAATSVASPTRVRSRERDRRGPSLAVKDRTEPSGSSR